MPKFCSECGTQLEENSKVCKKCGKNFEVKEVQESKLITANEKKSNGFAIAGFVLALVSLLCCGSTSLLGLIFSIIGLCNSKKLEGSGKGLSIAGIIISALILLAFIGLYALGIFASFTEAFDSVNNSRGVYY